MWTRTGVVFTTPRHRLMIKVAGTSCVLDNSSGSHLDTFTPTTLLRRAPGPMAPFCGWWQQRAAAGFWFTTLRFCQRCEMTRGITSGGDFSGSKRFSSAAGFCAPAPSCPLLNRNQGATWKEYYLQGVFQLSPQFQHQKEVFVFLHINES